MDIAEPVGFEIAGVDLELLRRRLHHHAARLARRDRDSIADAMRAARRERAHVVRAGIAIGCVDVDVLDRHAERLGRDLPRHRFHALAEIDGRQRDGELAARIGVHQSLARIAAEIHADRIVDRRHSLSAMLAHQRLRVPNTEEKRAAPCCVAGADGGAGGGRGGGAGRGGSAATGRAGCGAGGVGAVNGRS